MKFKSRTKGGIKVLELVELSKADDGYRHVAVLEGYSVPIMYNSVGICEDGHDIRGDDDLDLVAE